MRLLGQPHTFLALGAGQEGEKKAPKQGKEYGVEHGGAGQFAGIRIVSVGAARNAGVQGWGRPGEA